ncbi:MAG: hypothetical protein GQ525_03700, partial [Draconibacterium sp.]|nr:hypothetical protein [Draconibacterium sp.]
MRLIRKIYKRNIYGVMGTLVFHILIVLFFLLADVDMKGNTKEEALLIEFPDILPELEEQIEKQEMESSDEIPAENSESSNRTNAASNQLASTNTTTSAEEFFDDEYLKEIEAAKRLSSDVSNQLSKEVIDINDIKMPVETTEGMEPDSIKNVIYVGESNIVYYLENRYHKSLPIPVYLSQGGGKVIVDIVVNQQGFVTEATPRKNRNIREEQTFLYAKAAASKTVFNSDPDAPKAQKGTIHYTF